MRTQRIGVAVALATSLLVAPAGMAAEDPRRELDRAEQDADAAQARLAAIEARLTELQGQLDFAVRGYEGARQQLGRIDNEVVRLDAEVARAEAEAALVQQALHAYARDLYKAPPLGLYRWAATEESIGAALHRALTVRQLLRAGAARIDDTRRAREGVEERVAFAEQVRQGTAAALAELSERRVELDRLLAEVTTLEREAREVAQAATDRVTELAARLAPPVLVDGRACPVQGPRSFVDTWQAPRPEGRLHQGVDIFAPEGHEVYAVADGVVERAGNNRLGGIALHLRDAQGDVFYYAHLSGYAAGISAGSAVSAGNVVGYVGRTGNARFTPPHLHWEHRPGGGAPVNPTALATALCRPR